MSLCEDCVREPCCCADIAAAIDGRPARLAKTTPATAAARPATATRLELLVRAFVDDPSNERAREVAAAAYESDTLTLADLATELMLAPEMMPQAIAKAAAKALIRGPRAGGRWEERRKPDR